MHQKSKRWAKQRPGLEMKQKFARKFVHSQMPTSHGTKLLLLWKEKRDLSEKQRKLINLKIKNGIGISNCKVYENSKSFFNFYTVYATFIHISSIIVGAQLLSRRTVFGRYILWPLKMLF